ncbi:hypothetical protein [Streptomyces sp. BHT-5-2]|uniref:hypothetical protein n=1 Tax=Streptomyces sp. BHT-5-2 TaxID=2866715 RepID=UPI0037DA0E77
MPLLLPAGLAAPGLLFAALAFLFLGGAGVAVFGRLQLRTVFVGCLLLLVFLVVGVEGDDGGGLSAGAAVPRTIRSTIRSSWARRPWSTATRGR